MAARSFFQHSEEKRELPSPGVVSTISQSKPTAPFLTHLLHDIAFLRTYAGMHTPPHVQKSQPWLSLREGLEERLLLYRFCNKYINILNGDVIQIQKQTLSNNNIHSYEMRVSTTAHGSLRRNAILTKQPDHATLNSLIRMQRADSGPGRA